MFVALPRDTTNVESCGPSHCLEMEVAPGEAIYASPMENLPRGVFVPWDHLSDDQREEFLGVRRELLVVTDKLKAMFLCVGDVVDGC